jgi:hypothetical protein
LYVASLRRREWEGRWKRRKNRIPDEKSAREKDIVEGLKHVHKQIQGNLMQNMPGRGESI